MYTDCRCLRYDFSMRKSFKTIMILLTAVLLSGCTKKYDRSDILKYAEEVTGERPKTVSAEPEPVTSDYDEYTDYLWTVTMKNGLEFHVLDDYCWGMEALVNNLRNDYNSVVLVEQYDDLQVGSLQLQKETYEGIVTAQLVQTFSSRKEREELFQQLDTIQQAAQKPFNFLYELKFDHPYRTMNDYESTEADARGVINGDPIDAEYNERQLLYLCLDHQYACKAEFTAEEIDQALEGYNHRIGFRTSEEQEYDFSHPLVASAYSYGVSFATIYEVLKAMDLPVEGDPTHYRITNGEGTVYEISYSFVHPLETGKQGYYYLVNGEETDMDAPFYNHFTTYELRNKFGLDVIELWQNEKAQ